LWLLLEQILNYRNSDASVLFDIEWMYKSEQMANILINNSLCEHKRLESTYPLVRMTLSTQTVSLAVGRVVVAVCSGQHHLRDADPGVRILVTRPRVLGAPSRTSLKQRRLWGTATSSKPDRRGG